MKKEGPGIMVQCDFDGTITEEDVMVGLCNRFVDKDWFEWVHKWERKDTTLRGALLGMYSMIRASPEDVVDFIRSEVRIRKGFPEFVRWCKDNGVKFTIVSEGLDFVIEKTLEMIGVEAQVITNHAVFGDPYMTVTFPETPHVCDHEDRDICGTCKSTQVRSAQEQGLLVVYIGDGSTDVKPARMADLVFARRSLAKSLGDEGHDFFQFEDFEVIRDRMVDLMREL